MFSSAIGILNNVWQHVRLRLGGAIFSAIALWLPVVAFAWCFDVIDDLPARVFITFVVALLAVLEWMSAPTSWLSRRALFWYGLFLYLALLMLVGRRFELPVLSMNAGILIILLPYSFVAWVLMGRRRILVCAFLLGLAVMMVYWLKAMANEDVPLELLLAPVSVVVLAGLVWAPLARRSGSGSTQ